MSRGAKFAAKTLQDAWGTHSARHFNGTLLIIVRDLLKSIVKIQVLVLQECHTVSHKSFCQEFSSIVSHKSVRQE